MFSKQALAERQWWEDRRGQIWNLEEPANSIVSQRYGLPGPHMVTLELVAATHELTAYRVSRIIRDAKLEVIRQIAFYSQRPPSTFPGSQALIEELALSPRTYGQLKRYHVHTAGDIHSKNPAELSAIPGFGCKGIHDVVRAFAQRGIIWPPDA